MTVRGKKYMMHYQIKKKAFSLGDTFTITDAQGEPTYTAKSVILSIGHQLDLVDIAGHPVSHIKQRVPSLAPDYLISRDGQLVVEVRRDLLNLLHPHFAMEGPGGSYDVHGDWLNWNYTVESGGQQIAHIDKQFALTDTYQVDVADGGDIPTILCLAIILDEVAHQKR